MPRCEPTPFKEPTADFKFTLDKNESFTSYNYLIHNVKPFNDSWKL